MPDDRQAKISLRAYRIWEEAGRPFGEHDEHWEQARREIEAEEQAGKESAIGPISGERSTSG